MKTQSPLSAREHAVARLWRDGAAIDEIARRLRIAPGTVRGITARVYRKLGVTSRHELAAARVTTTGHRRSCAFVECRATFTPRRHDQRYCRRACARARVRRERAALNAAARSEGS